MLTTCTVCNRPLELEEAHWYHDPGCTFDGTDEVCTCDLNAHRECCPECRTARRHRIHDAINAALWALVIAGAVVLLILRLNG